MASKPEFRTLLRYDCGTEKKLRHDAPLHPAHQSIVDVGFLGGGAERDRTADLVNAIHALSQLSYGPKFPVGKPTGRRRPV
jgi:hypothetical protein